MKFVWLILTGLFCLCMNVLLWRSEYGGGSKGNPLPVNKVVAKILDTPDPSELDIFYQGKPVGHCRWVVTQLGQDDPEESVLNASDKEGEVDLEAAEMSGLIQNIHSYNVNVDGYIQGEGNPHRVRFMVNIRLNRQWEWIRFDGKIGIKNQWLHLHSDRKKEVFVLKIEQEETQWETQVSFDQFQNPQALAGLLLKENPFIAVTLTPLMGLLDSMYQPGSANSLQASDWAKKWEAFSDWMTVAHARMRIYRLESGQGNRNKLVITVNRAGEIVSISAPRKISLKNESVFGL